MSSSNNLIWLSCLLFSCPHKLTSKDKLVATYMIYGSEDNKGIFKKDPLYTQIISEQSGLALRTVQKSMGRLEAIGAIKFVAKDMFVLRRV